MGLDRLKKYMKEHKNNIIALIIALIIIVMAIAFTSRDVIGDEELMFCDGCKKTLELPYEDGVFTSVNFKYEWED